jgi:hypothetical protein
MQHCLSALPLAGLAYAATNGSGLAALAAATASVAIDCDHVTDYLLCNRGWDGVGHFFAMCEEGKLSRLYLLLHAWEWQVVLWLLVLAGLAPAWLTGLAIGLTGHLVLDSFGNRHLVRPSFYWLWVRASNGFDGNRLYRNRPQADTRV